ncbi:bifunctional oligoribonuclease/PAP phosphatase NrnA [Clostridium sp. cel8]|uniref:DHH family phosphoesterase n=1 Tax=Clostridium sp. cel8 TaxID=2663123 RepID=UPI0015F4745C|nr:bifunctional oligoribonuclease/PAP phosphatase NrnA [Clostridium sp. cel8]MBA5850456.1 bifunctional oligoribonuclease/PAP phosphatase NrnA [Clostridium sp. cel8]
MEINSVISEISNSKNIAITFHKSPDGDSIGSALALFQGLSSKGKEVSILSTEEIPEDFKFLPGSLNIDPEKFEVESKTECVIVLDCGDKKRINANLNFENRNYKIINIDHHVTNEKYGDINYIDTKAAAMSEIIYDILIELNVEINKDIAKCLYTSLITDTGSFKYSSTSERTHRIAGKLISTGFDFTGVHRIVFDNKKIENIKLLGRAIDNMKIIDDKICVIKITKSMIDDISKDQDIDTHDIVNTGLEIETVEVSVLLKESEDKIKVSLRSKNYVDVRKIAEKFGGGGHIRAAGLQVSDKDIDTVENMILKEIQEEMA